MLSTGMHTRLPQIVILVALQCGTDANGSMSQEDRFLPDTIKDILIDRTLQR